MTGELIHPRTKHCRQCHAIATHAEIETRPAAILHRDGTIERFAERITVYWCDAHTGIT